MRGGESMPSPDPKPSKANTHTNTANGNHTTYHSTQTKPFLIHP